MIGETAPQNHGLQDSLIEEPGMGRTSDPLAPKRLAGAAVVCAAASLVPPPASARQRRLPHLGGTRNPWTSRSEPPTPCTEWCSSSPRIAPNKLSFLR